ncbi:MAG: hypothetical protein LAN64_17305 [Acidobacteriia bacterium]|nr:hypothetical protein [Terriglobia bacterium]
MNADDKQRGATTQYWVVGLCAPALASLFLILTASVWWRKETLTARALSLSWAVLSAISLIGIVAAVVTAIVQTRKRWSLHTALFMWSLIVVAIGAIAYNFHVISGE